MGRYSRKDMIEFANFAKSYQSSRNVEEAYAAYLGGARIKTAHHTRTPSTSIHFRMMGAEIIYIDDILVKDRYGKETGDVQQIPLNRELDVISWDEATRVLKLKTRK